MLNRQNVGRPERRSAIISQELVKYDTDIAALSEVSFPKNCCIREKAGYSLYWNGKAAGERRPSGEALAIRDKRVTKLDNLAVSDRMITHRIHLSKDRWCTMIAVYAPTMTHCQDIINQIYH